MTTAFYTDYFLPHGFIFSANSHHNRHVVRLCTSHTITTSSRNRSRPHADAVVVIKTPDFKEPHHILSLLQRSCKAGNYDEALYFLQTLVNSGSGHNPDVILCTKLIKAFSSRSAIHKATRVMQILETHGQPDLFAYNAFVSALCKANRIDSANDVLRRMRTNGFLPDVVTYNIIIGSLCTRGKLKSALAMLDQLVHDRCNPTVITYTILIEATIVDGGGIAEAMKLFDQMLSRGLQPDMYTYNTILRGMCREGMVDEAFEFMRRVTPDVISYNILLRALLSRGRWKDAELLLVEMFSGGLGMNVVTYSIMVSALCREGQLDEAIKLLKMMMDEGLKPDTYTYDPLISALCKGGRLDLAIVLLDYMISNDCFPDIVNYNTVLSALCKTGNADQAMEVFGKLAETGCPPPDVSTYNTMVTALWNAGDRDMAFMLVSEMIHKGIDPDEITYNAIISCLCRDGMVDSAIELYRDMEKEFLPTVVTYNIVILGLCKAHRVDDAIGMLVEMVEKGCRPNETTYVLLVEGIGFASWNIKALEIARLVHQKNGISDASLRRLSRTFGRTEARK